MRPNKVVSIALIWCGAPRCAHGELTMAGGTDILDRQPPSAALLSIHLPYRETIMTSLMWLLVVFTTLLMSLANQAIAEPANFYAGKTIRVLVGLQAGGTVDTLARALAVHISRNIPGNPTVIVQNMPGAGGASAFNYLYEKANPDGLTILFGPWDPLAQVLGDQTLRARYEEFEYLGGNGDIRIIYMRSDAVPGNSGNLATSLKLTTWCSAHLITPTSPDYCRISPSMCSASSIK